MNGKQHRFLRVCLTVLAAVIVAVSAGPAQAQDVAAGQALADVLAALAVVAVQDLDFEDVLQGVMKAQDENDNALSGIFSITGAASAGLSVYIGLPEYMALADGSDRLVIAFGTTDCAIDTTVVTPSTVAAGDGWVNVDPHNLPAALVVGAGGQTNVYLGGKVIPAVNQSAGAYTGDIIVTVAYNGT